MKSKKEEDNNIYNTLSGVDLVEEFSLNSDQNQIFEFKMSDKNEAKN